MKKLTIIIFLLGTFSLNLAIAATSTKTVIGDWKYDVPTAPYGYQKGVISIIEKAGKLSGYIKFQDGYKVQLKEVKYENAILKIGLYIDYNYITAKATVKGKELKGTVNTPEGELAMKAVKQSSN